MRIGLYSELAREPIVKTRKEIAKSGIPKTNAEIISFRERLINSNKDSHAQIRSWGDFHCLSELRDMLFHFQEHRFTIPQIEKYLESLGLKFCGFETGEIIKGFEQKNPGEGSKYNLDTWKKYEESNPATFIGMYVFWCQKLALLQHPSRQHQLASMSTRHSETACSNARTRSMCTQQNTNLQDCCIHTTPSRR